LKKIGLKIKQMPHALGLPIPAYQSAGAAGLDVVAAIESSVVIEAGARLVVPTGITMEIDPGYEIQCRPRSGMAAKQGITVLNSPGTIDCVPGETEIHTDQGILTVDQLKLLPNTKVLSYNELLGTTEYKDIEKLWYVGEKDCLEFEFDDGTKLTCSETQLINSSLGWKSAINLKIGDNIFNSDTDSDK
jgi:hypothetical protein